MQKIRILSDFEIGCIAAGEVIENPASIIKELVENSIDAKASEIKIYFNSGGIDEIVIVDNGIGMSREDLSLAFIPHATSKLSHIDDLYYKNNIFFGFRGEALNSIAGVARVTIISREVDKLNGFSILADHGKLFDVEEVAANFGTTIIVKNLFEKLPARKKYLQSIKNQEKNILYIINGLVLSYPEINFIIYKDGKLYKNFLFAANFLERSYQCISQEKEKYISINYEDIYMKLGGLISVYEYGCYDKNKMFILANNRLIKQYKIFQSCIKAYNSENFAKKYPELYLKISVNPDQIDVNVHPRKEEVLFLYQKKIEQLLTEVLIKTLEERTKKIFENPIDYNNEFEKNIDLKLVNNYGAVITNKDDMNESLFQKDVQKVFEHSFENKKVQNNYNFENNLIDDNFKNNEKSIIKNSKNNNQKVFDSEDFYKSSINNKIFQEKLRDIVIDKDSFDEEFQKKEIINNVVQQNIFEEKNNRKFIGIFANTYILLFNEDAILFIDQHALHEKILYEEYIKNFKEKKILNHQLLLFRVSIVIPDIFCNIVSVEKNILYCFGIDYDIIGNDVIVKTFPHVLLKFDINILFINYLKLLMENEDKSDDVKIELILHDMAALYGCKNAVKAGDVLDKKEIDFLIQSASSLFNATWCPHGRPIYYRMSLGELHSLFKRK